MEHAYLILDIAAGSAPMLLIVLVGQWRLGQMMRKYLVEHEILIIDYCERHGIKSSMLPTRGGLIK